MQRRTAGGVLGAVVLAWVVGGCGTSADTTTVGGGVPSGVAPADLVLDNLERAERLFAADPEVWGGAYADDAVLVVKFVDQDREGALAALEDAGVQGEVRLVTTSTSWAELEEAMRRTDRVARQRDDIVGWAPDYKASAVAVDVSGSAEGVERSLRDAGITIPLTVRANQAAPDTNGS